MQLELVVRTRHDESDGVISLLLERQDGGVLPEWRAGAHIDLVLSDDLVRQYSLSSSPSAAHQWRVGVLREPAGRGGSEYIHDIVREGSTVEVSLPRNNFALHTAAHYIFIAGGIGVTPILPMIEQAEAAGADWTLLYGGRTRASMAFVDALARYGDRVTIAPQDEVGLLDLPGLLGTVRPDTLVYACGPEPLLKAAEAVVASAGWPASALHVERFAPKVIELAGEEVEFEVEFVDSGISVTVPADKSILEIAEDSGINVFSSCQEGTCGTCETTILGGRASHRDSLLTTSEQEAQSTMMICVSRAEAGCPKLRLQL